MNDTTNIPQMRSVRATAQATGLSCHAIRQLCRDNEIKYIKSGNKVLINLDLFIQYLNGEQQK